MSKKEKWVWRAICLLAGVVLLLAAAYAWYESHGVQLLYAHSQWGKIYRFYWIPGLLGGVCAIVGIVLLPKKKKNGGDAVDVLAGAPEVSKVEAPEVSKAEAPEMGRTEGSQETVVEEAEEKPEEVSNQVTELDPAGEPAMEAAEGNAEKEEQEVSGETTGEGDL